MLLCPEIFEVHKEAILNGLCPLNKTIVFLLALIVEERES